MGYQSIEFGVESGVASIVLSRPEALNAINREMLLELLEVVDRCTGDPEIRCVVVTGKGKVFCAGGDIKVFSGFSEIKRPDKEFKKVVTPLHRFIGGLCSMPKPVLAAVQGPAMGAGFSLALACDLVIASEVARFSSAYTNLGITPDGGLTYFLPRLVGEKRTMELVLSNRMLDATEAYKLGIVNAVVPVAEFEKVTGGWAGRLASGPTKAFGRIKELISLSPGNSLYKQLEAEIKRIAASGCTEDFREGISAFLGKKAPTFKGR